MSSYLFFLKDAIAWRNGHWKFYYDESGIGHEENDSTILGKWIEPVLQDGSSDLPKKWTFEITVVETEQTLKKTLFPLLSMTETRAQFWGQLVRIELLALSNFLKKNLLATHSSTADVLIPPLNNKHKTHPLSTLPLYWVHDLHTYSYHICLFQPISVDNKCSI